MVFFEILWSIQTKFTRLNGDQKENTEMEGFPMEFLYPESVSPYLDKFSETAKSYQTVYDFVQNEQKFDMDAPRQLYLSAFCEGVSLILDEFLLNLCEIEKMILEDEDISVISIAVLLDPISVSLSGIADGILNLKKKHITGCQILDLCNTYYRCGEPQVKEAYGKIIGYCMKPFFVQTKSWILYGELFDPNSEYFIEKVEENDNTNGTCSTINATAASQLKKKNDKIAPKYTIVPSRLPSFLPYSIAAKILFIGEMLTLCDRNSENEVSDLRDEILTQCGLNETVLTCKIEEVEKHYEFNLYAFDSVITDIWESVDKYTRKFVERVGDVYNQIVQMRDIYLLGRGELFQEFLFRAKDLLLAEPSNLVYRNLKVAFKNSVYYVYLSEDSELLESIDFKINDFPKKKGTKTWDVLELDVKVRWPLQSLFSPQIMENYKKLFKFLLRLKRAQMDILEVWMDTNVSKTASEMQIETMVLRNNLVALISNLQNYCFTDVIAKEMTQLSETFDNTDTYTEIQTALVIFQENVLQQLFIYDSDDLCLEEEVTGLNETEATGESVRRDESSIIQLNKRVRSCFKILFSICQKFSLLVKQKKLEDHPDIISYFTQKLNSSIRLLVKLSKAADKNYSNSYLQNLMVTLDYNRYFCEKGTESSKTSTKSQRSVLKTSKTS